VGTPATVLLAREGVPHEVRTYEHDPVAHGRGTSYGLEAAVALGVDPRQVFKTLVADVDGAPTVAVVPSTPPWTSRRWPRPRAASGPRWPTPRWPSG
jgi:Cys-tRNA(Pro)/Cys-tRNA(Cys) deacylase